LIAWLIAWLLDWLPDWLLDWLIDSGSNSEIHRPLWESPHHAVQLALFKGDTRMHLCFKQLLMRFRFCKHVSMHALAFLGVTAVKEYQKGV
jgi:hypothetical protein